MTYTKEQFLKAAELGEVSMIDAKHICSLLDEVVDVPQQNNDVREDDVEQSAVSFLGEKLKGYILCFNGEHQDYFNKTVKEAKEMELKAKENTYTEEQVREAIDMARMENGRGYYYDYTEDEIVELLKNKINN